MQNVVSNANTLLKELDALQHDAVSASVEVEYCIQKLNLISSKQFIEKRVYDEEVTDQEGLLCSVPPPLSTPADFVLKIKEAFRECLPGIKSQSITFGDGINGNTPGLLSRGSNNSYSNRCLPYILGTEEFIDSHCVGVEVEKQMINASDRSGVSEIHQPCQMLDSPHSFVQPPPPTNLLKPVTPPALQVHSDSDASSLSESGVGISVENDADAQPKQKHFSNFQDELASRLRGSSVVSRTSVLLPEEVSANAPSHVKGALTPSPGTVPAPGVNPIVIPSQPILPAPKKKNLFDDSSSESETELFKPASSKTQPSATNIFHSPPNIGNPYIPTSTTPHMEGDIKSSQPNIPRSKVDNLFESSDSEDELFGGIVSAKTTPKPLLKAFASKEVNKTTENESNIFSSKDEPAANTPTVFGSDTSDFVAPKSYATSPIEVKKVGGPNQRNLFADSDSEDDLFRNILPKKPDPAGQATKTLSISPLPYTAAINPDRYQSTPVQNGAAKTDNKLNRPASANESDTIPFPKEQGTKAKAKTSLLFEDDTDDDDELFGGFSTRKSDPGKTPLSLQSVEIDDGSGLPILPSKQQTDAPREETISRQLKTSNGTFIRSSSVEKKPPTSTSALKDDNLCEVQGMSSALTDEIPSGSNAVDNLFIQTPIEEDTGSKSSQVAVASDEEDFVDHVPSTVQPSERGKSSKLNIFEDSDDDDLFGTTSKPKLTDLATEINRQEGIDRSKGQDLFDGPTDPLPSKSSFESSTTSVPIVNDTENNESDTRPPFANHHQSKIAALKLSLAQQPNALGFGFPGTHISPTDPDDKTSPSSGVRKPIGGVPLFGPRIPSPVKSQPQSPTKIDVGIGTPENRDKQAEDSTTSSDLLNCVARLRPKAPSRRLPSRDFRRSHALIDQVDKAEVILLCLN